MCRPLLSITAWHLLLYEQINVLHSSMDISSHSPFKLVHSSLMFLGFFSLALSFSNFQIFSIVFMSGFWAGHSITITSSSERNVLTDFAVWHWALSYINTTGWLIAVLKLGTTYFSSFSLYIVALILPCSLTRVPVPAAEITPNTITLSPPNLMLLLVHWGEYHSLGLCQMNLLSSQSNRLNIEMNTIPLFFSQYDMFSGKFQSAHFVLFRNVRHFFKCISLCLWEIMCLDILMPRLALALFGIAVAVSNQSFVDSLPIHLSSLAVVFLGLPGGFLASHGPVS